MKALATAAAALLLLAVAVRSQEGVGGPLVEEAHSPPGSGDGGAGLQGAFYRLLSLETGRPAAHRRHHHPRIGHGGGKDIVSGRSLAASSLEAAHPWYRKATNMGVHQFEIPGMLNMEDDGWEPVVAHLYLKGLQRGDTVTFRGFIFLESAIYEWYNWGGTGVCMPQLAEKWEPYVFFRSILEPTSEHAFRVFKEVMFAEMAEPSMGSEEERARVCVPFPIELNMTTSQAAADFELRIGDWKNFVYFSPGTVQRPQLAPPRPLAATGPPPLPDVVAVLVPFLRPTPPEVAANILYFYIQYHLQLGFARFVQYTQSIYLGGFLEDERLRALVTEGRLEFVLWDSTTECTGHLKCFQPVMYSHTILAHFGQNVYLSLADHDEYLALSAPGRLSSVQDVMRQCFNGTTQANLRRYNIVCGPGECNHVTHGGEVHELDLWRSAGSSAHPLRAYTHRQRSPFNQERGKCFVHPDHMGGFDVHYGMVLPGGTETPGAKGLWGAPPALDTACGVWVHLVNLFRQREPTEDFERDTAWHWVLDRVALAPPAGRLARSLRS